jgi:hypothetical protein
MVTTLVQDIQVKPKEYLNLIWETYHSLHSSNGFWRKHYFCVNEVYGFLLIIADE